ncbi:MAG: hypothetical protein J7L39_03890, partial [Candidatus Aenigmarchaeota archaeon]|nr:hypothetical protein [Candidatus Aenigmarchaeota archaeon]
MTIPPQIIDNERIKLVDFLVNLLKDNPNTNLDIATAFFNVKAFEMVKDYVKGVKRFRLLLGKAPEIKSDKTLGEELLRIIKEEVEGLELSKENEDNVKTFIEFLKRPNVEVRIYDKQFLHGKTFIFDNAVVIGSSNFTPAGLTHNTELNTWLQEAQAEYVRKNWFEKFWEDAKDFKKELIELLEASRFGSREYTPYEVFIKVIYELQKEDIKEQEMLEERDGVIPSKVELSEFQEDAVVRIKSRLRKYGGVIIADSVGLGKTWITKKIIEEFGFYKRKNFLVICPAQLRRMWSEEIKSMMLPANVMSLEELASENFLKKAMEITSGHLEDVELVVVDESHNLRNPLSNRWENFYTLVWEHIAKKNKRLYIMFLTATPINNTIWDLYWQIMLIVGMDRTAFIREGIPDLFKFFKKVDAAGDATLLNDLLNEISIRRTRDYIKKNYPNATIKGKKITFPERILENIDYKLDEAYNGMYKRIAKTIAEELTMACYQLLKYKKVEKLTPEEEWELNRMIALSGILKTIFLKRLESSVEAFRISIRTHIHFLQKLKEYMKKGKLLTKPAFNKYIMHLDEEIEKFEDKLQTFNAEEYKIEELFSDIDKDIEILEEVLDSVEKITPEKDAKLNIVKKKLLELSERGQIILFTYYEDTLNYIWKQLQSSKEFKKLRIEKISGSTSTRERIRIEKELSERNIDILLSTDVLSEGTNLQSAQIVINYDLHWNPMRMLQRAGRIDRIGSPYEKIFVCNVFPEDELESLLRLVHILQTKITKIDEAIGLDQRILGEEIHPKVFGIIRRIRMRDTKILDELDEMTFGGGEKFYQPIKDFIKRQGLEELKRIEKIPYGIYSGLKKGRIRGIFFYFKYLDVFHFWYLYDIERKNFLTNKSEIIDFISCSPNEKRVIPEF